MKQGIPGRLGIFLISGLLLCVTVRVAAQADTCLRRTVMANVLTKAGQPVAAVPASSFRGTFRGKPVRVVSATRDLEPRRIVVLLDASGSMMDEGLKGPRGKWQYARRAVGNILNGLPAKDDIALLVFADKVDIVVGFAEGRQAIAEKISALKAGSKAFPKGLRRTALLDTILVGLTLLQPPHDGDVIYVISDGGDNASRAQPGKVEQALLTAGVRLFAMGLDYGPGNRATVEEIEGPDLMRKLAEDTGGAFLPLEDYAFTEEEAVALNLNVKLLYSQMSQPYRLELEFAEPVDKRRKWKLELVGDNGKKAKLWHTVYQSVLLPCKQVAAEK